VQSLLLIIAGITLANIATLFAGPFSINITVPPPAETGYFKTGASRTPDGHVLSVDSRSLLLDGQPWFPVMGEFHYSRVPQNEWRAELLKLKAGGVDIVSTYVFWIHHEEIEGQFDWSDRRDLRKFVQTCNELGLKVLVRCGPWCHGEVRNGGLPDWVVAHKDWKLRSTDTNFLAAVGVLYGQIAAQLNGLLWKDGGPVIGIQVDNEFGGSPGYLMALKQMAIDAGLDVPFYSKTGWPAMKTPVPLGELVPFFGAYADGFWDRTLTPMNGNGWENFIFKIVRTDTGIGNDTLGDRKSGDAAGTEKYPYLTCEIGGGMAASYHRRMNLDPRDVEAVVLTQLGGGSTLLGYYMFHGGQNPDGKLTTLQESQATGYPNDLPVKNYDFGAPVGEYGQLNPQYHWLRRLHLFLHDFGDTLATMPVTLPDLRPTNKTDLATLRWAVRSDGRSGFVFINNYQRLQPMPPKKAVQFKLNLPDGEFIFPSKPVTVPADEFFFWPFNLDLGGVKLVYATAQPVGRIDDGNIRTFFFAETPGVKAEFVFATGADGRDSTISRKRLKPGRKVACALKTPSGQQIQIVLLNEADSLALWKGRWSGRGRIFLAREGLVFDGDALRISWDHPGNPTVDIFPAPGEVASGTSKIPGKADGIFRCYYPLPAKTVSMKVETQPVQPAGPVREIPLSTGKSHIAVAATDADFTNAAAWQIKLPANLDLSLDPLLRIHYAGDVARLTLNGRLIDDHFYNGRAFDLGLKRFAPEILSGDLRLEILPLRKDAPIYLASQDRPDFRKSNRVAALSKVEVINRLDAEFTAPVR